MKPAEIEELIKKLHIKPGAEMYGRTLTDTLEAQKKSKEKSAARQPNMWRFIMESKVTKYSAAAVVAMAMALILLSPFGTPGNGGVVLADVQQKVADAETMVIRGQKTYLRPGEDGEVFEFLGIKYEFDLAKYFSKQHGLVEEGFRSNMASLRRDISRTN